MEKKKFFLSFMVAAGLLLVTPASYGTHFMPSNSLLLMKHRVKAPDELKGDVKTGSIIFPAGKQTVVTGDLKLESSGDVVIDGSLLAAQSDSGDGYDIIIEAEGDIVVGGTVRAGAPASYQPLSMGENGSKSIQANRPEDSPGEQGGSLTFFSKKGSVRIKRNSTIIAMSGTDGTNGKLGGGGGRGGWISLAAPYGKLTVHGNIEIGNGGNGGDAELDNDTLKVLRPRIDFNWEFNNSGGDSGMLLAFATRYDWPGLGFKGKGQGIFRSLYLDPLEYNYNINTGNIIGGIGGNAGSVYIVDDLAKKWVEHFTLIESGGTSTDALTLSYAAAPGGRGWKQGGNGGGISVTPAWWNNYNGVYVLVGGGNGGSVSYINLQFDNLYGTAVPALNAIGGIGGFARATASSGMPQGSVMGGDDGGDGGGAFVVGGAGGNTDDEIYQIGGAGGSAEAYTGYGADGMSSCYNSDIGNGGTGGDATALGGRGGVGQLPGEGGLAWAIAGTGGNGGDGQFGFGLGGKGGKAQTQDGAKGGTDYDTKPDPPSSVITSAEDGANGLGNIYLRPDYCPSSDYECPHGNLCGYQP